MRGVVHPDALAVGFDERSGDRQPEARARVAGAAGQQAEDLIQLGAYVSGTNTKLDAVIRMRPELLHFLQQDSRAECPWDDTLAGLHKLAALLP